MDSCYKMSAFVDFYVIVLFIIGTSDSCTDCEVMGWTSWSSCSKTGQQSIKSKICCPNQGNSNSSVEECIRKCKLTQEQMEVKRNCTYISLAHLAASTKIVSNSNMANEQSLTGSPSSKGNLLVSTRDATKRTNLQRLTGDVGNENQTIDSYALTNAPEYEKSTSEVVLDNTVSSKGSTEILTTDTSDISITRTTVQSSTSLYQEKVVASEYQTAYSSNAAENVVYTRDQTFNKQSITEERSGTSVTLTPETSNYRTFVQTSTGEKATSSHEPGYEFTSNRVNNSYYSTQEGTEYHVKSEASNARTSVPSSTSGYQGKGTTRSTVKTNIPASTVSSSSVSSNSKGNGTSNASQLSRNRIQEEGGTGGGVIAGAIIGVLAVAGLSGLLAFFLYRRWKKNKEEMKVEPEENGGENPVSQKPPASTSLN